MAKAILRALFLATFAFAASASAQTTPPAPNPAPANADGLTGAEAQRALDVLNDPSKRAELIETLRTVAKAAPQAAPAPKPAHAHAAHLSLKPNGLGAQLVVQAAALAEEASGEIVAASQGAADLPARWREAADLFADPTARNEALETGARVASVLGCAFLAEALLVLALRRPRARLELGKPAHKTEPRQPPLDENEAQAPIEDWRLMRRLPLALARLALSLLPIGAFAAVGGLLVAAQVDASDAARVISIEALKGYVVFRSITAVIRMLASPANPRLRLLHVSDAGAADIEIWARRIAGVTMGGVTLAESVQLLGASDALHSAIVRTGAFILGLVTLVLVLSRRGAIARCIQAEDEAHGQWARLRNRLAETWHYLAIAIAMVWLVWIVRLENSFSGSLQLTVVSVGVLILARLIAIVALGQFDRLVHLNRDHSARFAPFDRRAGRYTPLLRRLIGLTIGGATLAALLQIWGFDALGWFQANAIGGRLAAAAVTIGGAAGLAVAVWEGANAAVERHLARLSREARFARAARLRTLLPLLRTALLVVVGGVVGLTVLSEIGVNIAPLLAGAGIVGIAIGFGSQKLVQDLITGLFLLLENAVQVGDWVTVSGLSGAVEDLSIRTIRLRAGDGSVHIVPFSSVTSVTNSNRGIGNAAVSVSVDIAEDTDHVGRELQQIAIEMRREEPFKAAMLSDLQLWGVDKFDGVSATVVGQIVCTDTGRWDVQRQFNRRMKQRFQELGIAISPPNASVIIQSAARPPEEPGGTPVSLPDEAEPHSLREQRSAKVSATRR